MRYATIGTSWITESFISSANQFDEMELTAVYSRNQATASAFADKFGIKNYFTDLKLMAESKLIDAVYIASPNIFHYEQSKLFLENGKNVICEKPATTTKKQMEELFSIAEKHGLIYCEAIMTIHTDGFRKLAENLSSIGNIRSAHFDFYQLSSKYRQYIDNKNPNIFNPSLHTGCLMDIGVYNLYLAAGLFGKPVSLISDSIMLDNGCDAAGTSIFKYNNLSVILNYSKVGQTYSYSEIIGDNGTLRFDSVSQISDLIMINKQSTVRLTEKDIPRDTVMAGEIRFFIRMCDIINYDDKEYVFAKKTALDVRELSDKIRKDNSFLF